MPEDQPIEGRPLEKPVEAGPPASEPKESPAGACSSGKGLASFGGTSFSLLGRLKAIDKKQLFLLLMIFLLAFGVRGHLLKYEYMFGFDSYFHARMVGTLIQTGEIPAADPMAYYFMEGGMGPPQNVFFWHFTAWIYSIATLGLGYDKLLWIQFVKVLPALFGALISVAMYFLGKEMYGRKAGYAMAFFAAVVPSFVYRTLAGFFEEDSLGFLWLIIGLVFFVRAVKDPVFNKRGITNAVLAGAFFAVMAWTWEVFLLIPLVLGLYLVFALVHIFTKMGLRKLFDFVKLYAISLGIFMVMATLNYGSGWYLKAESYATQSVGKGLVSFGLPEEASGVLILGGLALFGCLFAFLAYSNRGASREKGTLAINLIATIVLYIGIISMIVVFLVIPVLFQESSVLGLTVGEENTGHQFFGSKYNALLVLPALALLLIPIRLFRDKRDHLSSMVLFWVMITWFMAWYKLKFTYTFGLPIAAAGGVIVAEMLYLLKSDSRLNKALLSIYISFLLGGFLWQLSQVAAVCVFLASLGAQVLYLFAGEKERSIRLLKYPALAGLAIFLLVGMAAATIFVPDNIPNIELGHPEWKSGLHWMSDPGNIPADAKMFNWWDEGHWISFVGERAVSSDNRNASFEANRDFALFIATSDLDEAVGITKSYDFDYVVLSSDMFLKISSLTYYAYNVVDNSDPRILPFLMGPHRADECGVSGEQIVCGPNTINLAQYKALPAEWTSASNQIYTSENGVTIPIYIYRAEDNSELYILNPAINQSVLGRLWLHEDGAMRYFEEVYSKAGIKIFRVRKEALP